jgi:flagellar L-ring protein precursor FlgH
MTGTLAAIIKEVLPNGVFRIEGRRTVTVNNEDQMMVLTGLIRRVDIGFDNTISSQKIANATIAYTGKGVISDEQNVGWLMRFFAWIWPF